MVDFIDCPVCNRSLSRIHYAGEDFWKCSSCGRGFVFVRSLLVDVTESLISQIGKQRYKTIIAEPQDAFSEKGAME